MRQLVLTASIFATLGFGLMAQSRQSLSLEEAANLLLANNNTIKISQKTIEVAKAQKQQLDATWYPFITATGGYFHFSNDISADANLGDLAQDALQNLQNAVPGLEQLLSQLLPQLQQTIASLGNSTLSVPLINSNAATADIVAIWPLITGGKRIYATRSGKEMVTGAQHLNALACNAQTALMLNAYYTLKLGLSVEKMQQENLQYISRLLKNAQRLKDEGFLNKAEYLVVQVAKDEAVREVETARHNVETANRALDAILGIETDILPDADYFTLDSIPGINTLKEQILLNNPQLKLLHSQREMAYNREKIAKSNYIPNIALFARQNIYSSNIPKNLVPRTTVGAAMQWDIFDGMARESQIRKTRLEQQQLEYATDQAEKELFTAAIALRSRMADASYSIKTLQSTRQLALELLREREKSFAEGLCTSADVIAARTSLTKAGTALDLAHWQYCTALANLLALTSNTYKFIELHNENRQQTAP